MPRQARAVLLLAVSTISACSPGPATTPPVSPGSAAQPRDVNIVARDDVFSPPVVDLVPGETVVFHVVNGGLSPHEAVIGDQRVQNAWEAAQANAPPVPPGATPHVSVPPDVAGLRVPVRSGERVDVVWTVPSSAAQVAALIVGCHVPGHYARGMHVNVRVAGTAG